VADKKHDLSQFGFRSAKTAQSGESQQCAQCEAMLMDALDGTLSPEDQAAFDLHLLGCPVCSAMLADAQRGAAWLEMLRDPRPEPPAELIERIFSLTSGAQTNDAATAEAQEILPAVAPNTLLGRPALVPTVYTSHIPNAKILPFRSRVGFNLRNLGHTLLQPRMAMTAAMAFFSVALTLSLVGVRLSDLRASSFRPSSIKRGISQANAHVVRYYDNLRVVYELESRVHDLQTSGSEDTRPASSTPAATPTAQPQPQQQQPSVDQQPSGQPEQQEPGKQPAPKPTNPGSSRRETPSSLRYTVAYTPRPSASPAPYPVPLDVSLPGLQPNFTSARVREGRLA
jgi:Putative zinc-finger